MRRARGEEDMCEEERGSTDGTEVARASDRLFQEEIRPSNGGRARRVTPSIGRASAGLSCAYVTVLSMRYVRGCVSECMSVCRPRPSWSDGRRSWPVCPLVPSSDFSLSLSLHASDLALFSIPPSLRRMGGRMDHGWTPDNTRTCIEGVRSLSERKPRRPSSKARAATTFEK